ncbi:MAG: MASE3 domain-containing protein [Candidatus Acetothermia bacterium]
MKKLETGLGGYTRPARIGGALLALTAGGYYLSTHNYLLFHSLAELFSIVVAFGIFVVAWNSRTFHENDYLTFIGIAYLFVGSIDLIHTLAYEGMGVFPNYGADLPTQLWIIGRYMESLSLLFAPVFFYRKLNYRIELLGYSLTSAVLLLTVFYWKIFPRCFVPGSGLTTFKVTSEYVISAILVGAILLLIYNRDEFDKGVFYFLLAALSLTVVSELFFTFYVSTYGISNLIGHLFKIGSFYLIYIALIDTGFKQPYRLLFKRLRDSERKYQRYFEKLGDALFITKVGGEDHGKILDANDRAAEQTGYDKEELMGMNIEDDLAVEPPTMGYNEGDEKLSHGETINFTEKKVRADGTEYWTEVVVTPIEHEGETASLSINRDVTERIRAQEQLQEERDKLKDLHDAVDLLQQQETEEDLAQTAVETAEGMLEFDLCAFDLVEGNKLVPRAHSSDLDPGDTKTLEIGEGLAGKAFQEGKTLLVDNLKNHPDAKPINKDLKACLSLPIGEVGVLQVISEEEGSFDEQDVRLAEILADHLNEEIQRIRLEEELREQAIKDPLTGLYNRRYFNESLGKEVERCRRYDEALAFLMIDVNRFKEINDRYTHQTGDEVLTETANLLQGNVRDADTVVRYGGDEFLIMMPETEEVEGTVNRLEEELKTWNEESDLLDFPLTLAMGAARWNPDQDRDVEEALKEADRKMYEDKESSNFDGHA